MRDGASATAIPSDAGPPPFSFALGVRPSADTGIGAPALLLREHFQIVTITAPHRASGPLIPEPAHSGAVLDETPLAFASGRETRGLLALGNTEIRFRISRHQRRS